MMEPLTEEQLDKSPATSRKHVNIAGKDYFTVTEAAHYACVCERQFREYAAAQGIIPFSWMGKKVYRKADIQRAMEQVAERQWRAITQTASAGTSSGGRTAGRRS